MKKYIWILVIFSSVAYSQCEPQFTEYYCEESGLGMSCWEGSCVDELMDCPCSPGDPNSDDVIDITDILVLVNYILVEYDYWTELALECIEGTGGDYNFDCNINVLDVVGMVFYIIDL